MCYSLRSFILQDNVYLFFGDRYIREEAQYAAVHDFLSAVITYAKEHRVGSDFNPKF